MVDGPNGVHNPIGRLFGSSLLIILINLVLYVIILYFITIFFFALLDYYDQTKKKYVLLEIIPPSQKNKTPFATDQLFSALYGLRTNRSFVDRLLRKKTVLSLEVVSTKTDGIRFIARLPKEIEHIFKQNIRSYLPDAKITKVKDYVTDEVLNSGRIVEFKQSSHFAYPLNTNDSISEHDPISYLTNTMTKLSNDELMSYQIVLSPSRPRSATKLRNNLLSGKNTRSHNSSSLFIWTIESIMHIVGYFIEAVADGISELTTGDVHKSKNVTSYQQRSVSPETKKLIATINTKLEQSLYQSSIRLFVASDDSKQVDARIKSFKSAMAVYNVSGLQSIVTKAHMVRQWIFNPQWQFKNRMLSPFSAKSMYLSTSELAALYHFPHSFSARTENVVKSLSKVLPAPLSLKNNRSFDVTLGENVYHDEITPIGLTKDERERHVYIIGGTGNGKTTMLEYGIVQDIKSGKGVAIIDPHGDSSQKLLNFIPKSRIKDVIYFNPRDLDYPIGLNLLELPEGLSGSELAHAQEMVTEAVISVFRKIFEDNSDGTAFRIERVLRNAVYTALTVEDATIFTVLRLLTDRNYRKKVTKDLKDESLKRFWDEELGKAGEYQRVKISSGPITRIERFERSEAARRVLGQVTSTINFDDILNSSKILICNFSKGRLGEDTSTLFGTTVIAKIQLAAWRRDNVAENKRVPFYLYVDEFQNFANQHFMELFTEARKYKVFLTIAQQSLFQLKDKKMFNTILDNIGSLFVFRSKSLETEKVLLHQFSPYLDKGDIANIPSYNFYAKISAIETQEPLSGRTIVLDTIKESELSEKVIESSRKIYGRKYVPEEDQSDTPEKKPIVNKKIEMKKAI